MGKNGLSKKIRDIKVIFHTRMVTIKDRNNMDLTVAEKFKQTELNKNGVNTDNHNVMVTHL